MSHRLDSINIAILNPSNQLHALESVIARKAEAQVIASVQSEEYEVS